MNESLRKEHINILLDKMDEEGMDSLTFNERAFLDDPTQEQPKPNGIIIIPGHGDIITENGIYSPKITINNMFDDVNAVNSIFESDDEHVIDDIVDFLEKHHGVEFTFHEEETTYVDKEHSITEMIIYKENYPKPSIVITIDNDPKNHHVTMEVYYKLFHQIEAAFPKESRLVYQTAFEEWIMSVFDDDVDSFGTFVDDPSI